MIHRSPQWLRRGCLLAALTACTPDGLPRETLSGPGARPTDIQPTIHTLDGRSLRFRGQDFEPWRIEHCAEDGRRRVAELHELLRLQPLGTWPTLCDELDGDYQALQLVFADHHARKVTLVCGTECATAGGYYPPLGIVVRISWNDIAFIEIR